MNSKSRKREDMFTVIYAATQNYVVMRASSCEAMRSFRFPSQMDKSKESFHDEDLSAHDFGYSKSPKTSKKTIKESVIVPKIYFAEESSLSTQLSEELNQFALSIRDTKAEDLKVQENSFMTCDQLETLLGGFCVYNNEDSCESFEVFDSQLSELSSIQSDEECIIIVKKPTNVTPLFEDTLCKTFTSTPRKDVQSVSAENFLYSLNMLKRFSCPAVNKVSEKIELCETALCMTVGFGSRMFATQSLKMRCVFDTVVKKYDLEKLSKFKLCLETIESLYERAAVLKPFRELNPCIKAKLKRRISKFVRTSKNGLEIYAEREEIADNLNHGDALTVKNERINDDNMFKGKFVILDIRKCPKLIRNISESILDSDKYQPFHQIMKKLAQKGIAEGKTLDKKITGKTKKIAKIKCKKCNGSISSVRFLAATASRSTFNEDDEHDYCCEYSAASASASAKAVVGGSSDLTNVSSGGVNSVNYPQLYHSKPESTPYPDNETTQIMFDSKEWTSSKSSPVKLKSRTAKFTTMRPVKPEPKTRLQKNSLTTLPGTKTDSAIFGDLNGYGNFDGNSLKELQFREPLRPSNPRFKHRNRKRSTTYSSATEDTESMLMSQFNEATRNSVLVPRLQLTDSVQDNDAGALTNNTTGPETLPTSSNICQYGDTQRDEMTGPSSLADTTKHSTEPTPRSQRENASESRELKRPVMQHKRKMKVVQTYKIARHNEQKLQNRRTSRIMSSESDNRYEKHEEILNQIQNFGEELLTQAKNVIDYQPAKTENGEQKRKVNFAVPKVEPRVDPLTPVLANALSLADAAEILAVIDRFNKSNKVKANNNNAEKLERIFQTQFKKVASYLQNSI